MVRGVRPTSEEEREENSMIEDYAIKFKNGRVKNWSIRNNEKWETKREDEICIRIRDGSRNIYRGNLGRKSITGNRKMPRDRTIGGYQRVLPIALRVDA